MRSKRLGPQFDESMQAGENGSQRVWDFFEDELLVLEEERVPAKNARRWTIEVLKRRVTRKECKRLRDEFEVGDFMAQKGLWNIA